MQHEDLPQESVGQIMAAAIGGDKRVLEELLAQQNVKRVRQPGAIQNVRYTPAHRTDEQIRALDPAERAIALANKRADSEAKEALGQHPQQDAQLASDLDAELMRLRTVAKLIAEVLPLYSSVKLRGLRAPARVRGACEKRRVRDVRKHQWVRDGENKHMYRCAYCLLSRVASSVDLLPTDSCAGLSTLMRHAKSLELLGHNIHSVEVEAGAGDGASGTEHVHICMRCGAWTARRCVNLAQACKGAAPPGSAGAHALSRVRRSLRPTTQALHGRRAAQPAQLG